MLLIIINVEKIYAASCFSGNCDTCIYLFIWIHCKSSPWCRFFSFWTAFWTCDICRVCERWVQGCMTCLCSCVKYRCALTDRRSRVWSVCGVPRRSSDCLFCDALPLFCHLLPLKSLRLSSHFLPKMHVFSVVLRVSGTCGYWSVLIREKETKKNNR